LQFANWKLQIPKVQICTCSFPQLCRFANLNSVFANLHIQGPNDTGDAESFHVHFLFIGIQAIDERRHVEVGTHSHSPKGIFNSNAANSACRGSLVIMEEDASSPRETGVFDRLPSKVIEL
jgi:hypothetical protein